MGPQNPTGDVNTHGHGKSPAQGDVGEPAMDDFSGILGWEQHDHGNHARAEEDENKCSEELSYEFGQQSGFRGHASPERDTACGPRSSLPRRDGLWLILSCEFEGCVATPGCGGETPPRQPAGRRRYARISA